MSRAATIVVCALVAFIVVAALHLFSRTEVSRFSDPSGKYTVIVSKRRYQSYLPRMPGQGGDAPGFVEILGPNRKSMGRVPIAMLQQVDVRWSSSGAEIRLIAEWDFVRHTCYYWSKDQERQIWVQR